MSENRSSSIVVLLSGTKAFHVSTILIIDDEDALRSNLCDMLIFEGFDVLEANSGHVGIDEARASVPDLIICDIAMPYIDGYHVLEALREDPRTARIPVIFLTARAERSAQQQGLELGAVDYITKPFDLQRLLEAVRQQLAV
jgi:DNA-binding response OmpR family regulator